MPYLLVQDFKLGLDARRNILTSPTGSLNKLSNGHVTRGGEVEKRRAFELVASLPESLDTMWLDATSEGLWVFTGKTPTAQQVQDLLSHGIRIMVLKHPRYPYVYGINNEMILDKVSWSTTFDGKLFVIADFISSGYNETICFYDDGVNHYIPSSNEWYRIPSPIDDTYKGMSWRKPDGSAITIAEFASDILESIKKDENFKNSYISSPSGNYSNNQIMLSGPPGKSFVVESGVMSQLDRLKYSEDFVVKTELFQEKEDSVAKVSATGSFSISAGSSGAASIGVTTRWIQWWVPQISQILIEKTDANGNSYYEDILYLAPGDVINSSSNPDPASWDSGTLLTSIAHNINLGTPIHGFSAVWSNYGGGWSGADPHSLSIIGPIENGLDYNGKRLIVELDNTAAQIAGFTAGSRDGYYPFLNEGMQISQHVKVDGNGNPVVATNADHNFYTVNFSTGIMNGAQDNTVSSIKIDGFEILGKRIYWKTSNNAMMSEIATQINAFQNVYDASFSDGKVIVTHKAGGSSENGSIINVTTNGTVLGAQVLPMHGGVDEIIGKPQITKVIIGINNVTTGTGGTHPTSELISPGIRCEINTKIESELFYSTHCASDITGAIAKYALSYKSKMHLVSDKSVFFSELNNPTSWDPQKTGAGFVNFSNNFSSYYGVNSISTYGENLVVFGDTSIQIWNWDPNPELNSQKQVLANTGTIEKSAVTQVGDIDVFYLSNSGIRSLRARDQTNSAMSNDIGTQIDSIVSKDIIELNGNFEHISSCIEPKDGRYMLAIGSKIYVLSYFIGSGIQAWSTYEPALGDIHRMISNERNVYIRTSNYIYKLSDDKYTTEVDSNICEVVMPYMDAQKPAHTKTYTGIDATVEGQWSVYAGTNTSNTSALELIANINNPTFALGRIPMSGISTHIGVKMTSTPSNVRSSIGNLMIHYRLNDAD
jgi:hypothetical protein